MPFSNARYNRLLEAYDKAYQEKRDLMRENRSLKRDLSSERELMDNTVSHIRALESRLYEIKQDALNREELFDKAKSRNRDLEIENALLQNIVMSQSEFINAGFGK